uniref:Uncharacterized protein n=1 Tax=Kryptolebias marmoratus TaxID=37003 RepID=A0A3Q2ZGN3_KRYMA
MEISEILSLGLDALSTTIAASDTISKLAPRRKCNIHIANSSKCYVLQNPEGRCVDPPPPRLPSSSSGSAAFAKTPCTGRGFSGVCTYELLDDSTQKATEHMAIFFKVRYDLNLNSNEYAVGVFDINRERKSSLFEELSRSGGTTFTKSQANGSSLTHTSQNVTIKATMSNNYDSVVKVHLSDK